MGAPVIAGALVVCAIGVPWLIVLPLHGAAMIAVHAVTLTAAFHGAGLVVARLADQRAAPTLLVLQWGIAALIGASGLAIACGAGTLAVHSAVVFGCVAIHTAALGIQFGTAVGRITDALTGSRAWLVPAALLAGLGAIAVLGAAGQGITQPFNDEANLLAQLRRVLDTGALGDPIGYPRSTSLGGQIALAAIASGPGESFGFTVDALAMVLALGLATARISPRDPDSAIWALLAVLGGCSLAVAPFDALPLWAPIGLVLVLFQMLGDAAGDGPPPLPFALTSGALASLRHEFAVLAAAALVAAWWPRRRDLRRTAILLGGAAWVVAPFAIARAVAWRSLPHAMAHPPPTVAHGGLGALALAAAVTAAIAVPGALVLRIALPESRGVRSAAAVTAIALAGAVARLGGAGGYSLRLALPISIGFALYVVTELARRRAAGSAALIAALALCALIHEDVTAAGRRRWARRLTGSASDIAALGASSGATPDPYAALLARVPSGAALAIWVGSPERIDYRGRILDVHTPAIARLRRHSWAPHRSELEALIGGVADYLLVERDDERVRRAQTEFVYRLVCEPWRPICADDLEAIAQHHPVIARAENAVLIDLRAQVVP